MKKVLFCLSALAVLATSCKKDDEQKTVTPTKENLSGNYKIGKLEMTVNGQTTDMTAQFYEPCQMDNITQLNADNSFVTVDAGVKCDPPGDYTSTWSLTNSTTIVLDGETMNIRSFDGKTLKIGAEESGTSYTFTLNKQ